MNFRKHYTINNDLHELRISAVTDEGLNVGSFTLSASVPSYADDMFNHFVTIDLGIRVKKSHKNKNLSRLMLLEAVKIIMFHRSALFEPEYLYLYIDADASVGYWDHVGMKSDHHGNYDDVKHKSLSRHRCTQGFGMEKSISLRTLMKFLEKGSTNVNDVIN